MSRIIKGSAKGTYTSSTITVDGDGRVISAASGSGGGAAVQMAAVVFNSPGTHTTSANSVWMQVCLAGGGGAAPTHNFGYFGNPGTATNFGTHATAPGGTRGMPQGPVGQGGSNSNNLYWSVGNSASGNTSNRTGGVIGGGNVGGLLFGGGSGASRVGDGPGSSGGSGGVTATVLKESTYGASTGVPITIGAGGTGPPGQNTHGSSGRVVVIEYET